MKNVSAGYKLIIFLFVLGTAFFAFQRYSAISLRSNDSNNVTLAQTTPPLSAWMWESPSKYTYEDQRKLLNKAFSRHISTIFLNIEEYVNIKESSLPPLEITQQLADYEQSLSKFIELSNKNNIQVIALAGDVTWSFDTHRYITAMLIEFVNNFNLAHSTTRFAGIQFDIEYYNSSEYKKASKKEKIKMSTAYLDLVETLLAKSETPFGLAIPYWFNRKDSEINFEYNSKQGTIFTHLQDILGLDTGTESDKPVLPNHLAIMSYRRKTLGNNGTVEIVKGLFKSLQKSNKALTLYIGQDTATNDTAMSFQPNEWNEFIEAVNVLNSTFDEYSSYGGVAVHHLSDYLKMEK